MINKMTSCVSCSISEAFVSLLLPSIHDRLSTTAPPSLFRLYFYPSSQIPLVVRPSFPPFFSVSVFCCMPTQSSSSLCLPTHLRFGSLPSAALCSASLPLHPLHFLSFLWIPAKTRADHIPEQYLPRRATLLRMCCSNKCCPFAQYFHAKTLFWCCGFPDVFVFGYKVCLCFVYDVRKRMKGALNPDVSAPTTDFPSFGSCCGGSMITWSTWVDHLSIVMYAEHLGTANERLIIYILLLLLPSSCFCFCAVSTSYDLCKKDGCHLRSLFLLCSDNNYCLHLTRTAGEDEQGRGEKEAKSVFWCREYILSFSRLRELF